MPDEIEQPLTLEGLLTILQGFREEDKEQRKEKIAQVIHTMTKSQEQVRKEIRLEFSAELRKIREEMCSIRSQVIGASTFVERVFNETEDERTDPHSESSVHKPSPLLVNTNGPRPAPASAPSMQPLPLVQQVSSCAGKDTLVLPTGSLLSKPCAQSTPPPRPAVQEASSDTCAGTLCASALPYPVARPAVLPAEYDGKTPWRRYALQFEAASQANGWPSDLKPKYLATLLRGTALAFFETLDSQVREDYRQLSQAFQARFGADHQQTVAHIQLRSRVQRTGESFAEFVTDVQRLTHLTFGNCPEEARDRIALEQFLDGIADLDIQERVRDSDPQTLHAALQAAVRIEASHRATRASRRHIRAATVQTSIPSRRRSERRQTELEPNANQSMQSTQQSGNADELA